MDYSAPGKRTKPIPGGETEEEYRRTMRKIMEGLTKDNFDTIMFLCKDYIPQGRNITTAMQLLKYLEDRDRVSQESAVFIAEVLHIVRRMDLLKVIPCIKNKKHFETEFLALSYSQFSNYRVLTVKLQEELSQKDFELFRYECTQHLNIRSLDAATNVLSLLRNLEEEDIISEDNYDDLIKILECIDNVKPLKMFQRLLEGDETVAVPANKQQRQRQQIQSSEAIFPDRSYRPPQNVSPPPTYDTSRRVEAMPSGATPSPPPPYEHTQRGERPRYFDEPNTKAKYHEEDAPARYDFDTPGAPGMIPRTNSRCFQGEEVTPKRLAGTSSRFESQGRPYSSMPPQNMGYNHNRHHSDNLYSSMVPGGYGMSPHMYEDTFRQSPSIYPVASYPQQLQHAVRTGFHIPGIQGRYQRQWSRDSPQQFQYPPQQPHSYMEPMHSHIEPRHVDPMYSHMEPIQQRRHTSSPGMPVIPPPDPIPNLTPLEENYSGLSLITDKLGATDINNSTGDRFITEVEEKATGSGFENLQTEPKPDPTAIPEHHQEMEELRKRNQELENLIKEQKNVGSYKMDSSPVGMCILINNVDFENNRKLDEYYRRIQYNNNPENRDKFPLPRIDLTNRTGSNVDADKLEKLMESLDFKVVRHDDMDQRGIKRVVTEAGSADHSTYDCFMLIILSHGDNGCVFGVDGFSVTIPDIQKPFFANNCKTLANKPKILIMQACQGVKQMPAIAPEADVTHDGPQPENLVDHSTPSKADFLLAYSTVPGYISYRSKVEGSYFVMEIVKIFKQHYQHQDLLSMMIMVNDEVGKYSNKQVPMPIPTLRKKVFFHLKEGCSLDDIDDGIIDGEYHEDEDVTTQALGAVGGTVSDPRFTSEAKMSTQESGEQEY